MKKSYLAMLVLVILTIVLVGGCKQVVLSAEPTPIATVTPTTTVTPASIPTPQEYNLISIGPGGGGTFWSGAVDPANEDIVYFGSDVGGIFKTTDGGKTWKIINNGLSDKYPNALGVVEIKIDPENTNIIYASTWDGLYKSSDKGEHWIPLLQGEPVSTVLIDGDELIVGNGDPFEDQDGKGIIYKGNINNWNEIKFDNEGNAIVKSIVKKDSIIYIATNKGVYKSNGNKFTSFNNGLTVLKTRRMLIDNNIIYLTTYDAESGSGGVYQLEGNTWKDITGNLNIQKPVYGLGDVYNLVPFTAIDGNLFAGTEDGLFKKEKDKTDWERTGLNVAYGWLDFWGFSVWYLMASKTNPDLIYLGNENILKSSDGGATLKQAYTNKVGDRTYYGRGTEISYVYDVAFDPNNEDKLYIGYDDFEFFISDDKGLTMKKLADPENFDGGAVNNIFVNPEQPSILYAASSGNAEDYSLEEPYVANEGNVYKSTDYGETWQDIGKDLSQNKVELYADFDTDTLYAAVWSDGLYKSIDDGKTWQKINSGISSNHVKGIWRIAKDNDNLYIGVNSINGAVYKSTNDGSSWKKLNMPTGNIIELEAKNNLVYVSVFNEGNVEVNGLYISEDSGETWERVLEQPRVSSITIDENNPNRVIASSSTWWMEFENINPGIYESSDKGYTWKKVAEITENTYILFVKLNPLTNELFVGTHGNGLFKSVSKDFKFPSLNILLDEISTVGPTVTTNCYDAWKSDPGCVGNEDYCKAWYKLYCDSGETREPTDEEVEAEMEK